VAAILLVASIRTPPLYHSNQNTKFLQGLADAWPERLGGDWTAGTVDGLPVFSALVEAVARLAPQAAFYLVEAALLVVFAVAFVALARRAAPREGRSLAFGLGVAGLLGVLAGERLREGFDGVAEQYMLGGFLQPSEFAVLYLPALLLAADGRRGALLFAAIPAAVHPAYILLSALVVATLLWTGWREGRAPHWPEAVLAAAIIVVPPIDLALRFAPTDPVTFARANDILAFERIPGHSDPAEWLNADAARKIVVALIGIAVAPRGVLRDVLVALFAVAALGTAAVALTGSAEIALVAPWRLSILIVPVALALAVGAFAEWLLIRAPVSRRTWRLGLPAVALAAGGWTAAEGLAWKHAAFAAAAVPPGHIAHVRSTAAPGDVYLTSVGDETFRLAARAPQYVTWKTHPYRDTEVLEWRERIELARDVFGGQAADRARGFDCAALERLVARDPITHVVVEADDPGLAEAEACPLLAPAHAGDEATVFVVAAAP
jgi:hypothetical protein